MDKFGIFKLLNSFCDYYDKNVKSKKTDFKEFKSDSDKNTPAKNLEIKKDNSPISPPVPLQDKMLNTIRRHDEIIKRVNSQKNSND